MPENKKTISAPELLDMNYGEIKPVVGEIIKEGLYILAGPPKVGKSWLALEIALAVAEGKKFWGEETMPGSVLVMAFEDTPGRTQSRLLEYTEYPLERLVFQHQPSLIGEGFEADVKAFAAEHQDFILLIVDTLQMIRKDAGKNEGYANDYQELKILKRLAEQLHIAVLMLHHLRKQGDADPLNRVSGSTGISGVADGTLVLDKPNRGSNDKAFLFCTGRDIPERKMELHFNDKSKHWEVVTDSGKPSPYQLPQQERAVLVILIQQVKAAAIQTTALKEYFCKAIGEREYSASQLSKMVFGSASDLEHYGITVKRNRIKGIRYLLFEYHEELDEHSGVGAGSAGEMGVCKFTGTNGTQNPENHLFMLKINDFPLEKQTDFNGTPPAPSRQLSP